MKILPGSQIQESSGVVLFKEINQAIAPWVRGAGLLEGAAGLIYDGLVSLDSPPLKAGSPPLRADLCLLVEFVTHFNIYLARFNPPQAEEENENHKAGVYKDQVPGHVAHQEPYLHNTEDHRKYHDDPQGRDAYLEL
jgi:hypothetical protein